MYNVHVYMYLIHMYMYIHPSIDHSFNRTRSSFLTQCKNLVLTYGANLIDDLADDINPDKLCQVHYNYENTFKSLVLNIT